VWVQLPRSSNFRRPGLRGLAMLIAKGNLVGAIRRRGLSTVSSALASTVALLTVSFPLVAGAAPTIVNDVTQLNPISVEAVVAPTTLDELISTVKSAHGPVSIAGSRHSMGGQTATEGAVQIDMRRFDQVLAFSAERKEITVQAGITWRKIQEFIDPHNLSVMIMQTYDNFTVGGSLSVNAHGRYIGLGPIVLSVNSIKIVLANGEVVTATPSDHSDVFYGAIGGYGAIGVIAEATLQLTDDVPVERETQVMSVDQYSRYFADRVRGNARVIFHNADIFPNAFDTVRAISFLATDKPVTVADRLVPADKHYWRYRAAFNVISEASGGKWFRQHIIDPLLFEGNCVEWRNYEASLDTRELEPASRATSTYVLQEYFVPVNQLTNFIPRMAAVLNDHHVNVINISIRHSKQDPGTLMAWARTEVFAFVLYYKQGTTPSDRKAVGEWTRELIDAAISFGGTYYLPYQIHATKAQFLAAYPQAERFFELKKKLDPEYKFRNKLLDAYFDPSPPRVSPFEETDEVKVKY
jgi:FAD/FMN-containing dehydrogenase